MHDIPALHIIRNAVKENALSDPGLVKDEDYVRYLINEGKGWVCEMENHIVGFSIVDLKENNVWALFVDPEFEKKGIGKQLLKELLNWYFTQSNTTLWLGTAFNTRAEEFYRKQGWADAGFHGTKERKFIMTYEAWMKLNNCK